MCIYVYNIGAQPGIRVAARWRGHFDLWSVLTSWHPPRHHLLARAPPRPPPRLFYFSFKRRYNCTHLCCIQPVYRYIYKRECVCTSSRISRIPTYTHIMCTTVGLCMRYKPCFIACIQYIVHYQRTKKKIKKSVGRFCACVCVDPYNRYIRSIRTCVFSVRVKYL